MYVSVIIPAHNAEATLAETLESLCAQTHMAWEAIIVDDGSTDATLPIAECFVRRDRRFHVVSQPQAGVSAARNLGINVARYNWLLFLDADDWIHPYHLERMTRVLETDDNLDAVCCGWAYVTTDGHEVFKQLPEATGDLFAFYAKHCPFAIHAYVVRRALVEAVGGFDTSLVVCEDWDMWQRIARASAHFGVLRQMLAPYRMRAGSASMDAHKTLTDGLCVLQRGHGPDPRVPMPHPVYPQGLPTQQLAPQQFYLLCSAAGLAIGRGEDARFLLNLLKNTTCTTLDPYVVAACMVQTAMFSACCPLRAWDTAWHHYEPRARDFLSALEVHVGTPHLTRRALIISRRLIRKYMAPISQFHRVGALKARLLLLVSILRPALTTHAQLLLSQLKHIDRNGLRVTPRLYRHVCALRRRFSPAENRAFFENLFATAPDPWNYTTVYEQTKYEQTLRLIPDAPIAEALELGCAEGHFTVQLAARVGRLLAMDISQIALDRAAERCSGSTNVCFQRLDLTKHSIPGCFDLIVCSEVLYYARNRQRLRTVASKLAKALKPGGHLVMAHGNVVIDEPDRPGFNWSHAFGAKVIGEIFAQVPTLAFVKEVRTPLYRVQLFRRELAADLTMHLGVPASVEMAQAARLPPEVAAQVLWNGSTDRLPIVMYHRIAPTGSEGLAPWRVTPEAFEEQLCYLRDAGCQSVSLEDWEAWVVQDVPLPRGAILITFDDGYRDFLEHAWPLLQLYGFSATVYLVADEIGRHNRWDQAAGEVIPLLSWREIKQLQAEGVSFGSHSATHRSLSSLRLQEVVRELRRSKAVLEQGLGTAVRSFAYPYGAFNWVIQYLTGACGYDFGLSCKPGLCTVNDSLLALPRLQVEGSDTLEMFATKLKPDAEGALFKNPSNSRSAAL